MSLTATSGEQCVARFTEAIGVFEQFRDSDYRSVPDDYKLTWQNVLAGRKRGDAVIPCVFKSGPLEGYFGSLTNLRNNLTGDKGECEINDQINPLAIPTLATSPPTNKAETYKLFTKEYRMLITDQVATAPCTDPIQE